MGEQSSVPVLSIKTILAQNITEQVATINGWIRSVRKSKKFSFIVINDGSSQSDLQIIADEVLANYEAVSSMHIGTSVSITGKLVASGGKGQKVEMQAQQVTIIGATDENYPLQKKATSLEYLREQAHLRVRTSTFSAIYRLRHTLSLATHQFFDERGFYYVHTPILTGVDAEGAGEMFKVTTLPLNKLPRNDKGEIDFSQDYFQKEASLAVTGQLEGECLAMGLGKVYTFGPTFRAENSNTPRHLSEFWMIEPEVAFIDLNGVADLARDYFQALVKAAFERCEEELQFLSKRRQQEGDEDHLPHLQQVLQGKCERITYTHAIELLQQSGKTFDFKPEWGAELQTEHERFLAEEYFKGSVIVTNYPKQCKAFYMKQNSDGKTVQAMDYLVPGVGEIIGGSQREDDLVKLEKRMDELNMQKAPMWWYLDLRRYGTVPHGGFGLGFERAVQYISGMKNIRDVIPFPRTPRHLDF